jgi:3'(2'), 5'-bisphosphate nucleotidase
VIDLSRALQIALGAALEASDLVMHVYRTAFTVEFKAPDDPVTCADRESNALLCDRLGKAFPGIPLVAEESDAQSYAGFAAHDDAWFIDPLDGTREFVARNGEFAVMIGLARRGRAALGVIVAPAWNRAFAGIVGDAAWEFGRDGSKAPIRVSDRASLQNASIVVSRSRTPSKLAALLSALAGSTATMHGSSGLKAALVATGTHDIYVQPGPAGMRWDACASEALVEAAGGACSAIDGARIDYRASELVNSKGLLATNGRLHQKVIEAISSRRGG